MLDERYMERRKRVEGMFTVEKLKPDSIRVELSPSGKYQLEIRTYTTGEKTWDYTRGIVTKIEESKPIADVKRNYHHFWHAWFQHPNGNEYLLCGEDYQGYSVVNLTTREYHCYFPEDAYRGAGFCWASAYPSPDGLALVVDGCYWACPYELVLYDLSNPDALPLPEIKRMADACMYDSDGWDDNNTFRYVREIDGDDDAEPVSEPGYFLRNEPSTAKEETNAG